MYGQDMESFDLYGDLSLFNGDLLLEDVSPPAVAQHQGLKDGPSIHEAVPAPTLEASVLLAHPQNGSQDKGLQDLLTASPTQDLPDPFTAKSAWFDTKTDLLDLLSGVENQAQEHVQQVDMAPVAIPPQQDMSIESLEAIQAMLLADLPVNTTSATSVPAVDTSSSSVVVYDNVYPQPVSPAPVASNADIDILDELNQAGLEQLLEDAPDPNTASLFDHPILSPVSADDVESILSSSPSSPSQDVTLASLFSSFTSKTVTLDREEVGGVLSARPQRPVREKARQTPYTIRAVTPSPPAAASSRKAPRVDRRERKKEQNRTAALRYREKKRSEQDVLEQECSELMDANRKLREKKDNIMRELKYLKDLMADVKRERSKIKKGGAS